MKKRGKPKVIYGWSNLAMVSKFNVNIIMCSDVNEDTTIINGIFDTIELGSDNKISFKLVTLINSVNDKKEKFLLVYLIEKLSENGEKHKIRLLTVNEMTSKNVGNESDKQSQHLVKSSIPNSGQSIIAQHLKDVDFPGKGFYEIQVYMFDLDDEKNKELLSGTISNEFLKKINSTKEDIVSTYGFEVV